MIVDSIKWLPHADAEQIDEAMRLCVADGAKALMVLAGEKAPLFPEQMDSVLRAVQVPVFGGIFPFVIHETMHSDVGAVVLGLREAPTVVELVQPVADVTERFDPDLLHLRDKHPASVMIWVHGLNDRLASLVEVIYDVFGSAPSYLGGIAGSYLYDKDRPFLFSNHGMLREALLVVGFARRCAVELKHGLVPVAGPFVVSESSGNRIATLDYRSAGKSFLSVLELLQGDRIAPDSFFDAVQAFPLGIERVDGSFVVRDPVKLEGDALICSGAVPAQATLRVLRAVPTNLVQAARIAVEAAFAQGNGEVGAALLVSCVARDLLLGAAYREELEVARAVLDLHGCEKAPMVGVLSLGEIASSGSRCLELLNKTFTVGLLPQ